MHGNYRGNIHRYNGSHGPKRQLLGHHQVPPAWRPDLPSQTGKGKEVRDTGSKIFITRLPFDVSEKEIEDLFKQTVGPLKESFLVYNSQGKSKGMAVVAFQRPGDAAIARAKYDGKIVDGRRPIRIEIMVDGVPSPSSAGPAPLTLLNRIAPPQTPFSSRPNGTQNGAPMPPVAPRPTSKPLRVGPMAKNTKPAPIPPRRLRVKKGPKRLKKREPVTIADLDKEMDEYRSAALELA